MTVEEKKKADQGRSGAEDKWSRLKSYRRAKGLCFICGEMWIKEHQCKNRTVLDSAPQHLLRMQQRMKHQADKNRTERMFVVGDEVFLKLQPYIQASVVRRANHKLAFKFFGPYRIVDRVGAVAYKMDLPSSSKIHPVFHVSQLKPCLGPGQ